MALATGGAHARSGGINGYSGNPATQGGQICTACHAGGIVPTVLLAGPTAVQPLTTHTYTLTITGGQQIAGGLDVSATAGPLVVVDPGTYLRSDEITHSAPRNAVGGVVSFSFNWTAPAAAGSYTLYGAGNSVNLANGTNGDNANRDVLQITVTTASAPGEASGESLPALRATGYDRLTGDISIGYGAACGTADHSVYYGTLAQLNSYGWSGESCAIGTGGAHTFDPGPDSYFFIVVGRDGAVEGSYGRSRQPAGVRTERPPFAGNACGTIQDLTGRCD